MSDLEVITLERVRWATSIKAAWRATLEAVLDTGRLLCEAKAALEHGDWLAMVANDLPFSARTAQRLMAVHEDERLSNATHGPLLPPSWRTLYEITRLDDPTFDYLIETGVINPECERGDITAALKGEKRATREKALAVKIADANEALADPDKLYGLILSDPPWRFEPYSRETGMDRAADNHYPTATMDQLKAMSPPAADDCVMFMWATVPMLPQALDLLDDWGFEYKSHWIWEKDKQGNGYWNFNIHELLLIGVRGDIPAPTPGTQPVSIITAPVGAHSEKPAIFHELIEGLFPHLPKLEMFARSGRPGWEYWGAEAPESEAAE